MIKLVFFLFVVVLNFENIVSKSFQLHENGFLKAELEDEERSTSKTKSEDGVIWKRIDMNPREGSLTNKEEGNDFFEQQPTSPQMVNENEDIAENEKASENKNEFALKELPFSDNSLDEILDGQNIIANGTGLENIFSANSLSVELEPQNLTNAIVIDFSNITGDAIVIDTLIENASSEDYLDEVSEMSKGEPIAFLHEMPTSSFEFLIDAQTRRNILLKELLGSQTVLSVEDDIEPSTTRDIEPSLSTIDLHSRGNNFEELMLNDKSVPVSEESEVVEIASEGNLNETTTFTETELRNNSENIVPECPQPGWCVFWFLSQDTCAVNSHCLGSRICCKTGCSKTCVDV